MYLRLESVALYSLGLKQKALAKEQWYRLEQLTQLGSTEGVEVKKSGRPQLPCVESPVGHTQTPPGS